jgi:hypothetical protein
MYLTRVVALSACGHLTLVCCCQTSVDLVDALHAVDKQNAFGGGDL